jgi:hypothetical protein
LGGSFLSTSFEDTFFYDFIDWGGISAANYLRILLESSSSKISGEGSIIFFPALMNAYFFYFYLDFSLEFEILEGGLSQLS